MYGHAQRAHRSGARRAVTDHVHGVGHGPSVIQATGIFQQKQSAQPNPINKQTNKRETKKAQLRIKPSNYRVNKQA